MDWTTLVPIGLSLVVAIFVLFFLMSRVGDWLQALAMKRKARRSLHTKGYVALVAEIDAEIERLEENVREAKAQAATIAGRSSVSAALGGVYNELRWWRKYRAVVEKGRGDRD